MQILTYAVTISQKKKRNEIATTFEFGGYGPRMIELGLHVRGVSVK